eukprot:14752447-Alexandrium_andersonii.AAC.1
MCIRDRDWTVPVAQAPQEDQEGAFLSSVSLHDAVTAEKWCARLKRQEKPLAIIAIGEGNEAWPNEKIHIPVIRPDPTTGVVKKAFLRGVIYQFGETPVATKVSVTKVESSGQAAP